MLGEEDQLPTIPDEGAEPAPMPAMPTAQAGEVAVPLKSLAQPDDKEQVQTPAEGDAVTFTVDATVTRIEGETAYVKVSAVNGNPIDDEAAEPAPDNEMQEGADLRSMAVQAGM